MQPFLTFNLGFCNLATVLATFLKIGQFFFKLLVTLLFFPLNATNTLFLVNFSLPVLAGAEFKPNVCREVGYLFLI